jgi:hypothetical protein
MITRLNHGLYEVPSHTSERTYVCDARGLTCTCPDFQRRRRNNAPEDPERRCKHLMQLENYLAEQSELSRMADRAAPLSEEMLYRFARARTGDAVGAACWLELAGRKAKDERDARLKELFR